MKTASGFAAYERDVTEAYSQLRGEGGDVEESVRIEWFMEGLHHLPFEDDKKNYKNVITRKLLPVTYSEVVKLMRESFDRWASASRSDGDTNRILVGKTSSTRRHSEKSKQTSGAKSGSSPSNVNARTAAAGDGKKVWPKCSICEKNHPGECADVEAVRKHLEKQMQEELAKKLEATEKLAAKIEEKRKAKQGARVTAVRKQQVLAATTCIDCEHAYGEDNVKTYAPQDGDIISALSPVSIEATCASQHENLRSSCGASKPADEFKDLKPLERRYQSLCAYAVPRGCTRFVVDSGAVVNTIEEDVADSFGFDRRRAPERLIGVAEAYTEEAVTLHFDLGRALVHPFLNVLSDKELLKHHTYEFVTDVNGPQPHILDIKHKTTGRTFRAVRDEATYGEFLFFIDLYRDGRQKLPQAAFLASFYQPRLIGTRVPTAEEETLISQAQYDHFRLGHPSDDVFKQLIGSMPGVQATVRGLELWREIWGPCVGCVADKPRHPKLTSSQPIVCAPGEIMCGDIMFLDTEKRKKPALVLVDAGSKCPFFEPIGGRTLGDLKTAVTSLMVNWTRAGHKPVELRFDRESAILAAKVWIETTYAMVLKPKAAGQKEPVAEVNIRIIKSKARRLKAGILHRFGYMFPFKKLLYKYAVQLVQRTPKQREAKSPIEQFSLALALDAERDLRCELGEPIYVEAPKSGVYTGSEPRMELGIFVESEMNGTGVLGVYLLATRRKVHRLQFQRCELSKWDQDALAMPHTVDEDPSFLDEGTDVNDQVSGDGDGSMQVDREVEEPIPPNDSAFERPLEELPAAVEIANESGTELAVDTSEASSDIAEDDQKEVEPPVEESSSQKQEGRYNLRSRSNRPDYRAMLGSYQAVGITFSKEILRVIQSGISADGEELDDSNFLGMLMVLQVSYQQALKSRNAAAAREAMIKEIKQALGFKAFHGVHYRDLSEEERALILKSTSLFREKYMPSGEFEKYKARFLVRGDMQKDEYVQATSSPVVRHESVMWFIAVCVYCKLKRVKIDFVGAYLNTPRPKNVKYKHVWIPADIAAILVEIEPAFKEFVHSDGRILVEMDKLFYGYKEAALYWYLLLVGVLLKYGFKASYWDPCILRLFNDSHEIIMAVTVDDVLAGSTTDEGISFLIKICESEFEGGITVQEGDVLPHLGMIFDFSIPGQCSVTQRKIVDDLLERTDEWKSQLRWAKTPMSPTYLDKEYVEQQEELSNEYRKMYHSLVMSVMYLATRTWPQLLYASSVLSGQVNSPKRYHWNALMRVLAYVSVRAESHRLVIRPGSLNVITSADASAMSHRNMHGHTGGCVGVQGGDDVPDCYLHFFSQMQPIIGKSAMECEVIAQDTTADYAIWSEGIRNDLVPPSILNDMAIKTAVVQGKDSDESKSVYDRFEAIIMQCDNQAAIHALEHGRGTFKRCKHILKRYFWITELINAGRVVLRWISGLLMPADLLTKPVTEEVHDELLQLLIGK